MNYSEQYKNIYQSLPEKLAEHYPQLNLDNHCYLRIALDNTFKARWDTVISRPAYKNLNEKQINKLRALLNSYFNNKELLLEHNQNSLRWRNKKKSN